MARNKNKFEYVEVSFLKESELYQQLSADANRSAQSLAQIILVRLADYYSTRGAEPDEPKPQSKSAEPRAKVHHQKMSVSPSTTSARKPPKDEYVPEEADRSEGGYDFSKALAGADLFDQFN